MQTFFMIEFLSFLAIYATRSQEKGVNHNFSVSSHPTPLLTSTVTTGRQPIITVIRGVVAKEGHNLSLTCSNKTWNEMIFTIWKINIGGSECQVSFDNIRELNTCNDRKRMTNTTRGESYLHIPNFSVKDVGVYHCESVYKGGANTQDITVTILARPKVSTWLEKREGKRVAVCLAEGQPTASISWRNTWNSSIPPENYNTSNQAKSLFYLPEDISNKNLTCVVTHPYWTQGEMSQLDLQTEAPPWLLVTISVVTVTIIMIAGGVCFTRKHLCSKSTAVPPASKAPQECVEEVEPYASYVQRVNSIYNSSAELFT